MTLRFRQSPVCAREAEIRDESEKKCVLLVNDASVWYFLNGGETKNAESEKKRQKK